MGTQKSVFDHKSTREFIRQLPTRLLGKMQRRADASDVAQETMMQIVSQKKPLNQLQKSYLVSAARGNESKLRRFHNQACRSVDRESGNPRDAVELRTPDRVLEQRERLAWLIEEASTLPETERIAISHHCFFEKSFAQIARELGSTERKWRTAYNRAIQVLALRARTAGIEYDDE